MLYYYNYWHYISTFLPLYRGHLQQDHYYPYDCRDDGCV